ncbi:phage major tail protein, TP901-1 family [Paremcibacter congregatus]|uniref:phage major tail protein, TP901-1 family n=1 Tax=Paremcibacter congregatus TaxID=2043170 RepID=UPI0030EC4ECB|tara:strand:- start:50 stop:457 length:408 start_codon:yes stop_codon:yes gene_type:complete
MAIEKGRAFLLKIGDGGGPENFAVIGGMRSTSLRINNETVDVTNKTSGGWRELLSGAGIRHVSLSGGGIFTDSAAENLLKAKALTSSVDNYEVVFESGGKFTGGFQVTSLEYTGDYNGERSYALSLESSGVVSYV